MFPSGFEQENGVLDAPAGMSPEQCEPLSVFRGATPDGYNAVISCWKLTPEELAEINRTGRIWLWVFGKTMPPVALDGISPFIVDRNSQ